MINGQIFQVKSDKIRGGYTNIVYNNLGGFDSDSILQLSTGPS